MSRALRKAIESTKQKKENSIRLSDEGISSLYEAPELCTLTLFVCNLKLMALYFSVSAHHITRLVLSHNKISGMYNI